jgi:hypothetical protein
MSAASRGMSSAGRSGAGERFAVSGTLEIVSMSKSHHRRVTHMMTAFVL